MKTQLLHSDEFLKHDHVNHPENAKRLIAMMQEIKKTSFLDEFIKFHT